MVFRELVLDVLLVKHFDAFRWCHLQLLSESLQGKSHQDLEELVADDLTFRIDTLVLPEWEVLGPQCISGDES